MKQKSPKASWNTRTFIAWRLLHYSRIWKHSQVSQGGDFDTSEWRSCSRTAQLASPSARPPPHGLSLVPFRQSMRSGWDPDSECCPCLLLAREHWLLASFPHSVLGTLFQRLQVSHGGSYTCKRYKAGPAPSQLLHTGQPSPGVYMLRQAWERPPHLPVS